MNIKKILYIIFGCISFGLGAVGAVLPVLPTFPFLIFAAFCFARSSKKLDKWFKGTKLYKNNLETYAKGQGMTRKTKVRIMITVTFLMSFGFFIMFRKNPIVVQDFVRTLPSTKHLYQNSIAVIHFMLHDLCRPSRQFLTLFFP